MVYYPPVSILESTVSAGFQTISMDYLTGIVGLGLEVLSLLALLCNAVLLCAWKFLSFV